jgi:hypothetical protein
MRERKGAYRVLVGRCDENRSLGRIKLRWEYNTNKYLQKEGWGGMD